MAASPADLPPSNAASEAKSSPPSGLLAITAGFATSQLAALTAFFGAIGAAYLSFRKLQSGLGLSIGECAALVSTLLALLFFSHTLPTMLERRRKDKLAQITGSTKPGYFQLAPREDEESFQRADGKQDEVLKWLRQPSRRVLYLTGSSGSGKSSLLAAWVLPKLAREGVKVIRLRGYQDPAQALEDELKRTGVIWKRNPPETRDLSALFEEAHQRVQPERILVVFDQFEEFLILQEEQHRERFLEFLAVQAGLREAGSAILLVFRAEYDGFIQELNLPTPIPGQNLQKVSAFTQRAAQDFLLGSGLQIQPQLLADVLREAARVEETKGLIRPVTLNLCGLLLSRFATGLPHAFRPGRLIRGFVHEAVFQKEVREASPILLPKLISHQVTKQPFAIGDLATGTALTPRQVQGVMFQLGDPERGIVHALDPEYTMWEISHDFLVPMIDSMLAQWRVSLLRKLRPWLPLGYVAVLLAALFLVPRLIPDPIADLNRLHWGTKVVDANNPSYAEYAKSGIKYVLTFDSIPPPASVRDLQRMPGLFEVELSGVHAFDTAHFGTWAGLANLKALDLKANPELTDISAAKRLSHVTRIDLPWGFPVTGADLTNLPQSLTSLAFGNSQITASGLKALPQSLTSLVLGRDVQITDEGMQSLPRSLSSLVIQDGERITDEGLKDLPLSLTSFEFWHGIQITDAGLKDLPRSLTSLVLDYGKAQITDAGLKDLPRSLTRLDLPYGTKITNAGLPDLPRTLISLNLDGDVRITDHGLRDLPRTLTSLNLDGDTQITDAGLKDLPPTLRVLDLSSCDQIADAGLKDLPRSLAEIDLGNDIRITDAGLKELPRALTWLGLLNDSQITDAGLKDLPRSLTSLNLYGDAMITDEGLKDLPRTLTSLNLSGDPKITDSGIKDLPRSLTSLELSADPEITDAGLRALPVAVRVTQ
jgi:hypothetical protein